MNFQLYQRQLLLPDFGLVGQKKLHEAKVLVVGAGGLGCPAILYLAAAGVGCIGIADYDQIEESNLHRQILFQASDISKGKAETACHKIKVAYPQINVIEHVLRIDEWNAANILADYSLVIDCTDNFASRYALDDACKAQNKVLVYGSVSRYEGQVAVFNLADKNGNSSCYRDIFPEIPNEAAIQNCAEAGVIGVLTGIIGCLQANEVIKIITGLGTPLANKILSYHSLHNFFYETQIVKAETTDKPNQTADTLALLRDDLNVLDQSILQLLAKRKNLVRTIGKEKKQLNLAVVQAQQWEKTIQNRIFEAQQLDLDTDFIKAIFDRIHQASINEQEKHDHGN